jgi:hypothetical protein
MMIGAQDPWRRDGAGWTNRAPPNQVDARKRDGRILQPSPARRHAEAARPLERIPAMSPFRPEASAAGAFAAAVQMANPNASGTAYTAIATSCCRRAPPDCRRW